MGKVPQRRRIGVIKGVKITLIGESGRDSGRKGCHSTGHDCACKGAWSGHASPFGMWTLAGHEAEVTSFFRCPSKGVFGLIVPHQANTLQSRR